MSCVKSRYEADGEHSKFVCTLCVVTVLHESLHGDLHTIVHTGLGEVLWPLRSWPYSTPMFQTLAINEPSSPPSNG